VKGRRGEVVEMAASQRTLDCAGLYCPEPLFRTRQEIDRLNPGEVLEVLADDPAAEEDLRRFAKRTGHEVVEAEWREGTLRILIRKNGTSV
jgi:tRNA 2-thiouridine synthesizing protein A